MWIKQVFNKQWTDSVHKLAEKYTDQQGDYEIVSLKDPTKKEKKTENYLMRAIPTAKERQLADFVKDTAFKANCEMYGFNVWFETDSIQYTTYKSDTNMEFPLHTDSVWFGKPVVHKLTIVIGLTDKDEYTGGEFVIGGRAETSIKLTAGQAIVFPSIMWHGVKPVLTGTRQTLVAWYKGPRWM
jgi:predicted 2-oxoglutarate/Fe(II)-dependent dioxygenase YbiX